MSGQSDLRVTHGQGVGGHTPLSSSFGSPNLPEISGQNSQTCNYTVYAVSVPNNTVRQILQQNDRRKGLIVALASGSQMGVLLQASDPNGTDYTGQAALLQTLINNAIPIDTTITAQNGIDFANVPTNAISIVNHSGVSISVIVAEGM